MRPYDANTKKKVLSLRRDNIDTEHYWILACEDHVTIAKQKNGHPCDAIVEVNRADFNKLISWYMRDQAPIKSGKRRD